MVQKIGTILVIIVVFLSCQKDENKGSSMSKSESMKIDSVANRYLALNRFSGNVLIAKNEEVLYNKNYGLADYENNKPFSKNTAFKVGEISQLISNEILLNLLKLNKISSTDKVSKYLPNEDSKIKIEDIFDFAMIDTSNIAGKLIEKISAKSFQENIENYSSELKLENTFFNKENRPFATGHIYQNFQGNGLKVQKSTSYNLAEAFSSLGLKSTASDLVKIISSIKKDLRVDGYLQGDGFSYSLIKDQDKQITIIVLSNKRQPITKEITNCIEAILANKSYTLPLLREAYAVDKNSLIKFTGSYALNENVNFKVKLENDSLFVILGPSKVHLIPQSANQFYMQDMDSAMRFMVDSTGSFNEVKLLDGFIDSDLKAKRIE